MLVLKGNKKYFAKVKETFHKAKVSKVRNINKEKFKELDLIIFNELKKMRFELAKEQRLPAYLIFSDAPLSEISIDKPINLNEFSRINGVGEKKLKRYGDLFVEKINQIKSKSNLKEENSVN
jgi:ATP-dependent DNA helicase RecQ